MTFRKERKIKMLNLAICDDNIPITGKLETLLQKLGKKNFIDLETEVFWDGQDLVKSIEQGANYDIIYLDIEMKKEDGISAAKRIRKYDKNVLIIYVTSHDSYMKSSFDVRPFRFLIKPVQQIEFERCFLEAYEEVISGDFYFRYRYQRINHKIPIKEILYFESQKRKIIIATISETRDMYGKLNDIEEKLKVCKVSFLRVHQSFLVNYKHIAGQAYDYIMMDDGRRISISEDRRKIISEQYCTMEDTFHGNL